MPEFQGRRSLRAKRVARLHLKDNAPSVEGLLMGRFNGHYILQAPKILETKERTYSLDGWLEVPAEKVLYVQVIG
jgi:hypothetical protein